MGGCLAFLKTIRFQKWENNLDLFVVLLKERCCLNILSMKNYHNYSLWSDHTLFIIRVVIPRDLKNLERHMIGNFQCEVTQDTRKANRC